MNKVEGCLYDNGRPFKQVASPKARPPIYNDSLAFLIFHRCEGDIAPMNGIAEFNNLNIDGETYFTPQFSQYMESAIPVKIQQRGTLSNSPIRWDTPTGLNMQTYTYGTRNGYLVNAQNPPLGAYSDLFLTNRSALPQSTYLNPAPNANQYPVDQIVRAGDIFSIATGGTPGKCLFSLIPYTTYFPQGNTCYRYDDINANLIKEFYDNPEYEAFTNPCHCNPRMRRCLNRKEDFQVGQLIANGDNDVDAGTQVVIESAVENERAVDDIRRRRGRRRRGSKRARVAGLESTNLVIAILVVLAAIFVILFVWYSRKKFGTNVNK